MSASPDPAGLAAGPGQGGRDAATFAVGLFDSKNALYDAVFAGGNPQLLDTLDLIDLPVDPRVALKAHLGAFADFAVADPARNSLLLRRVIPGFEPKAASPEAA